MSSIKVPAAFVFGAFLASAASYIYALQPSYTPLLSAVTGLAIAFAIPIWQTFYLNAPNLEVEISAIRRSVSEAATVAINDYPELAVLRTYFETTSRGRRVFYTSYASTLDDWEIPISPSGSSMLKISQLESLLERARQSIKDLPTQIEERRKELERVDALTAASFTKAECDRLNQPLDPEIDFDPGNKESNIEDLRGAYRRRLETSEKRLAELQSHLPTAERKIEVLKKELIDNRSFFTVSASLVNSGRTNTAIKVPSLLRVSIGEGNYIDIKLTLRDFETKSEISANGTLIVILESPEISSFPEEDRRLINTYWGQSVSARIYIEDIHERCYGSNRIAFSEGLYQKIIYDRLAQFAAISN